MLSFNNKDLLLSKIIRVFFYSNIFLGVCAVILCIETNLLFKVPLNSVIFYLFIFFCTCLYYTTIYVRSAGAKSYDDRTIWYRNNFVVIKKICSFSVIISIALAVFLLTKNIGSFFSLSFFQIALSVTFPVIAGWYTFSPDFFGLKKIRLTGWIKPFIVGLTWAGMVTVYPLFFYETPMRKESESEVSFLLLFALNFLFFSVNAIIFDIKDYRTDSFHQLKTYPVILGIRKTFKFIILPFVILDFTVFFLFQRQQRFSVLQTCVQLLPHLLLIYIILSHRQQRSVLYYLAAVDGLVFVKAFCGITSIILLKKY